MSFYPHTENTGKAEKLHYTEKPEDLRQALKITFDGFPEPALCSLPDEEARFSKDNERLPAERKLRMEIQIKQIKRKQRTSQECHKKHIRLYFSPICRCILPKSINFVPINIYS